MIYETQTEQGIKFNHGTFQLTRKKQIITDE